MAEEFQVTSESIQSQIRNLLPSQSRAGMGFDLSGSSMIVPIIDLTEAARGTQLRSDLSRARDASISAVTLTQGSTYPYTLTSTGGFYAINYVFSFFNNSGVAAEGVEGNFQLFDGTTANNFDRFNIQGSNNNSTPIYSNDVDVFVRAGDSVRVNVTGIDANEFFALCVTFRQIADLYGNLTNPLGFQVQ